MLFRPRNALRGVAMLVLLWIPQSAAAWERWSLDDALLPDRFSLTVDFRSRYEFLDDPFRIGQMGSDQIVALRTLVHGTVRLFDGVKVGAEFEDSRAYETGNTPVNTTIVDAVELLRAYVAVDVSDFLGGSVSAQAGRITMDVGSRRFVARNRFRNTINGFTGVDVMWKGSGELAGRELRAFWTLPVQRLPNEPDRVRDNDIEFDEEHLNMQFWGFFGAIDLADCGRFEGFFFGLNEHDGHGFATRDRNLYTPGFRWFRKPEAGRFDYQFESAVQFGHSHASTTTTEKIDNLAHFHHVEFGYSFDAPCKPRLALQYDYASGDKHPDNGHDQRFDTLFGARRFDFGPTGIYGPFARANLQSPGVRFQFNPHPDVASFVAFRSYWLAADRDAWTTTGVRDATGDSGSYIGSQLEFRILWDVLPGNAAFETGYAHLFAGTFIDEAPNSNHEGDSDYVYSQVTLSF